VQPVTCRTCGNRALAEKYSEAHTSIQWLTDATQTCPRLLADAGTGHSPSWVPSCPELRDTIDAVARSGELPMSHRSQSTAFDQETFRDGS
jgi:hypothetical protein